MKKNILSWVVGLVSCVVSLFYIQPVSFAAPCYGTHMPDKGKLSIGGQAHVIENKKLKGDYGKVSSRQYFYQMSWGVFDWFSLDGKIGIGDVTYRQPNKDKVTYQTNCAGGYGFRAKIYKNDRQKIDVVCGFQHISVHPGTKVIDGSTNYVILDDWQGSSLVSKDLGLFTPYIGGRLTRLDVIHRIKGNSRKRKSSEVDFLPVVGTDYNLSNSSFINIEARFIKEISFNIGFTHNF